jgi:hypothetical protein
MDKLVDTLLKYEYTATSGYYYTNGAEINSYYQDGKLKSVSRWETGYTLFDYLYVNEDYELKYTDFGDIDEIISFQYVGGKRIPFSISNHYYTNTKLDSIVRKDYNNYTDEWSYYDKLVYFYSENGYEEITFSWIPALNTFAETYKFDALIEDGKEQQVTYYIKGGSEWNYRFHTEYEYNEDEYAVIDVEKSGIYSKHTYRYNDDDLMEEALYFWSNGYWRLDFKSEYIYFRSSTSANSVRNIKDELFVYSHRNKIFIQSRAETKVNICTITGFVFFVNLHPGLNEITLPKGVYIVRGRKIIIL